MPTPHAQYRMHALSSQRALVSYQLVVEPGGTLPEWLRRRIVRNLAHDTLADLRDRVRWARQRGAYTARAASLVSAARGKGYRDAMPTTTAHVSR